MRLGYVTCDHTYVRLTLGVRENVEVKSSIPIGVKVQNQPQGLHTRCQGSNRK
jgi:hypothetical protein